MTEIKLNTNVNLDAVQQANLLSTLNTLEAKTELSPLLSRSSNLTVASAPVDLDALLAKMNVETSDTKEAAAKTTLASAFGVVIAKAEESGNVSAHNMEILNEAKNYSTQVEELGKQIADLNKEIKQLNQSISSGEKTVSAAQKKVDQLTSKLETLQKQQAEAMKSVETLQADVDELNSLIDAETDPTNKAQLEKQLTDAESRLAKAQNNLTAIQQNVTATQTQLTQAQTTLGNAQADLAAKKNTLAEKTQTKQDAATQKADLEQKIKDKMNEITDVSVIRDLANALKIDVSDVKNFMTEEKAERSEEQEKYLDKHNPLRIMQDAVNNHDQEILDTIASKREEKI